MRIRLLLAVLPLSVVILAVPLRAEDMGDKAALRALSQAYADNWKERNVDALMALFTPDVTTVPHHGAAPVEGRDALRKTWFPEEGPPTVVPEYRLRPTEVLVMGDVGVVRGRFRLVFEFDGTRTTIPDGNFVHIARRTADGWKLRLLTWNDDPRLWTQEPVE